MRRAFFDTAVLLAIFVTPLWVSATLLVVGLLLFARWWESLGYGLLFEVLYASAIAPWAGIVFPTLLTAAFLLLCSEYARTALRKSH